MTLHPYLGFIASRPWRTIERFMKSENKVMVDLLSRPGLSKDAEEMIDKALKMLLFCA